jgi:hypothetical protein
LTTSSWEQQPPPPLDVFMLYPNYRGFLFSRNVATFLLGVYDSGIGYTTTAAAWTAYLTSSRRLFELPINTHLNYWFGAAPANAMTSLMDALQASGIKYLQTGNCFSTTPAGGLINTCDSYVTTLRAHPGLAGYYTADECVASLASPTFAGYQRLKSLDPDSITFAALNSVGQLPLWRDAVDLISTSLGRWPTQAELRNMSYMAITEGANGLFYWSIGAGALGYVCNSTSSWCPERLDYFTRLKNVLTELSSLQPVLSSPDAPALLLSNNNPAVHTRAKTGYLFAYNHTNVPVSATFVWSSSSSASSNSGGATVTVYNEGRTLSSTLATSGLTFSDAFGPYEAHVYQIK